MRVVRVIQLAFNRLKGADGFLLALDVTQAQMHEFIRPFTCHGLRHGKQGTKNGRAGFIAVHHMGRNIDQIVGTIAKSGPGDRDPALPFGDQHQPWRGMTAHGLGTPAPNTVAKSNWCDGKLCILQLRRNRLFNNVIHNTPPSVNACIMAKTRAKNNPLLPVEAEQRVSVDFGHVNRFP